MRKLIKIFIVWNLCFVSYNLNGQTYNPFPTDSAKWSCETYSYNAWVLPPIPDACITIHYGLSGDTLIAASQYNKLYRNNSGAVDFNLSTATYVAAVREDTIKKVWVRMAGDSLDILYYDFALDSGDTFCFDYFGTGCYPVTSVDSILIQGSYRRQINFQAHNGETWIEGIGSTTGWFEWKWTGSISYSLRCFHEYGNQLYGYIGNCHCDTYHIGIPPSEPDDGLRVFPNPAATDVNLEFDNDPGEVSIELFDLTSGKISKIKAAGNKIKFNLSHLTSGSYFIVITDNDHNRWTKKLIIIE